MLNEPLLAFLKAILVYSYIKLIVTIHTSQVADYFYCNILCKINLAIFDVAYTFDHLRAILDISSI